MTGHSGLGKGDPPITGSTRQIFIGLTHPVFRTLNSITSVEVGAIAGFTDSVPSHALPDKPAVAPTSQAIMHLKGSELVGSSILDHDAKN